MRPMASSSELMMKCTFKQLRSENEHLRNLVVSITATVLRNVAVDFYKSSRAANSTDAEQFVREAEDCFRKAIKIANAQGSKAWELRAAVALSRSLIKSNRHDEARRELVPVLDWFTEGLDTPDFLDATELLQGLTAWRAAENIGDDVQQ